MVEAVTKYKYSFSRNHTCVQQETRQAIMWQMTYH